MAKNGSDTLVNHTIKGLIEGVSEQSNELRRETQVDSMTNCIPHISRGVLRRNPIEFGSYLVDRNGIELNPEDFYCYTYDRGTNNEQYMILVGDRKWYSYNISKDYTGDRLVGTHQDNYASSIHIGYTATDYLNTNGKHPKEVFSFVTVGDYTWLNNNQITTKMKGVEDLLKQKEYKKLGVYWVKKTDNKVIKQKADGTVETRGLTYDLKVGNGISGHVLSSNSPSDNCSSNGNHSVLRVLANSVLLALTSIAFCCNVFILILQKNITIQVC